MQINHRTITVGSSRLFCLFAFLALSLKLCFAQVPSGQFTFDFSPDTTPLVDLSGNFDASQNIIGAGGTLIPLVYSIGLTNDPSGKLRGSGVAIVQVGGDFVAATYTASGNVSGGGTKPVKVSLTVQLNGGGTIASQETNFRISLRYSLTVNIANADMEGTAHGSANFSELGSGQIREDAISVPLPGGTDGSWSATLTVVPFIKLGGTGFISMPNGRTLQGTITGSYSSSSGVSKIKLTGTNGDKGFNVTFTTSSTEEGLQLETVRGKIFGQSLLE